MPFFITFLAVIVALNVELCPEERDETMTGYAGSGIVSRSRHGMKGYESSIIRRSSDRARVRQTRGGARVFVVFA
jgi:hypothetical protein